jgi:hypothetical protein
MVCPAGGGEEGGDSNGRALGAQVATEPVVLEMDSSGSVVDLSFAAAITVQGAGPLFRKH